MMALRPVLAAVALTAIGLLASTPGHAAEPKPFAQIEAEARGGSVNFFLWGGDERINAFISGPVAEALERDHGITVNRVGVADTAEVVNQVLSETEAGVTDAGSVDLVWINGENFRTLKVGGLVLCGYARGLPNAGLVDWEDPSISTDFGTPVDDCEVPWSRANFAFGTDSARVATPPKTMGALIDWIRANPGRFAYPAPPDFNGSAFIRQLFIHAAGGPDAVAGPFDQGRFDAIAEKAFGLLEALEPSLWRGGETYPTSIAQLNQLFANGEVDFTFNYEPTVFGANVENGTFPPTTRSFTLDDGTLANTSYIAIPANARNRSAAMVLANALLSVDLQYEKARPDVWGMATVLDLDRLTPADADRFRAIPRHPAVVAPEQLADVAMPEPSAAWVTAIEARWKETIGR
ncbi:ABC transporter substrate-binding protein [Chthonobacter albigriseus]|uniref:ABC transporter substrate-binding protein n=1 Tax=Chthonobacter albigriseus TaxID=1683161 RepID=UPI0019D4F4B5|nr:ABC transporter substrate-binding protein [Chthonobacter albigriseus]